MSRIFAALIISVLFASCAYAGGIEAITLIDIRGEGDTSLLVNASESQKAEYYPGEKMPSQILAFWVNGVLYDVGLQDGQVISRLAENGISPESVRTILITHLHHDHFGGLLDSDGKTAFPNAEVYMSKPEYDYWVNKVRNKSVIAALKLYTVRQFVYGDEVVPGVRAIDTSGHTPGHASYLVEADGEKLIVAGDIMHFPEIQIPHPEVAVRYDEDRVKAVQSRKFLLDYAASKNIPIAGMHITPPGIIQVTKSGEGYVKH
ncbi:MAG: MBL fold metallo-hydrolase [Synergistaceae bacterium]|nr:MBL fold metallo-hydrolase [Synergistaceae bacterium]MBQ7169048.1 MBL fold metallo-hydrolase [Synergistaceae bacterium]